MNINKINSANNFGMAKLNDTLKTRVVRAWIEATPKERSEMDSYLKEIANNCKGATVYRPYKTAFEDIYALDIPHTEGSRTICNIPATNRGNMVKVLQKIAANISKLDDTVTPLHKASTHIDEIMKEG